MVASHRFDPEEFLHLVTSLARRQPVSEAEARRAISRAYYAVHLYARDRLIASGHMTSTNTGADHQLVVTTLRRLGGMEGDGVDWPAGAAHSCRLPTGAGHNG